MPQANNSFSSPIVLSGVTGIITDQTNAGCDMETDEPQQEGGGFGWDGHSANTLWYEWTATYTGTMAIDFIIVSESGSGGLNFSVYTGTAVDDLTFIATNYNNYNNHFWDCVDGTTYKIQVWSRGPWVGTAPFDDGAVYGFHLVWDERIFRDRAESIGSSEYGSLAFYPARTPFTRDVEPGYGFFVIYVGVWVKWTPSTDGVMRFRLTPSSAVENLQLLVYDPGDAPLLPSGAPDWDYQEDALTMDPVTTYGGVEAGYYRWAQVLDEPGGHTLELIMRYSAGRTYHVRPTWGTVPSVTDTVTLDWRMLPFTEESEYEIHWSNPEVPTEEPPVPNLTGTVDLGRRWFS